MGGEGEERGGREEERERWGLERGERGRREEEKEK